MRGLPKTVIGRLKRIALSREDDRQPAIVNRQSTIDNRQSPHPDANLITAFLEKTLTERERAEVLNHLARCVECRDVVALALPAEVTAVERTPSLVRKGWMVWPALRWAVLVAACGVVAIVALWHSHLWRRQAAITLDKRSTMAANSSQATPKPVPEISSQPGPGPTVKHAAIESPQPPRVVESLKKRRAPRRFEMTSASPPGAGHESEEALMVAERPPAPAPPPAAQSVPPARARPQSVTVTGAANTGLAGDATAQVTTPQPAPGAAQEEKGLVAGAPVPAAAPMRAKSATSNPRSLQAKMPSMAFRAQLQSMAARPVAHWTISPQGKPQRSEDAGNTWQEVHIDDKVTFRAIEAVGTDVWAGGSDGALFHSSDGGASWTRVSLGSGGGSATETIVSIAASPLNPRHLVVKAANGEQWTSDDGGQHWTLVTNDQ